MNPNFKFVHREGNHWDIYNDVGRLYKIRGDAQNGFVLISEFNVGVGCQKLFPSLESCMSYVCAAMILETKK